MAKVKITVTELMEYAQMTYSEVYRVTDEEVRALVIDLVATDSAPLSEAELNDTVKAIRADINRAARVDYQVERLIGAWESEFEVKQEAER